MSEPMSARYFADAEAYARRNPPLPWLYYDPASRVFVNQQSLGRVWRLSPVNLPSLPQESAERLYHALQHALNALPANTIVQVHERHTTHLGTVLASLQTQLAELETVPPAQRLPSHVFLRAQTLDRLQTLRDPTDDPAKRPKLIEHYLSIYMLFPLKLDLRSLVMRFRGFTAANPHAFLTFPQGGPRTVEELARAFDAVQSEFFDKLEHAYRAAGSILGAQAMTEGDLIRALRAAFGHPQEVAVIEGQRLPIVEQALPPHVYLSCLGFHARPEARDADPSILTDRVTTAHHVSLYPAKVRLGALAPLTGVTGDFLVTVNLFQDPNIRRTFDATQAMNVQFGALGNRAGIAKFFKDQVIGQRLTSGNRGWRSATVISCLGNAEETERLTRALANLFQMPELAIPLHRDRLYGPVSYLASLPFGYDPVIGHRTRLNVPILTESARSLLPLFGNHPRYAQQDKTSGLQLRTAEGGLKYLKLDALAAPAKHGLVVGTTGSGKSFLLNYLLDTTLNEGGAAFVMDPGGSMEPCIAIHGGSFYTISPAQPFKANIFAGPLFVLDEETGEPSQAKFNLLLNFLMIMVFGLEPQESTLTLNVARDLIGQAVKAAYDEIETYAHTTGYSGQGPVRANARVNNVTLSLVRSKIDDASGVHGELVQELRRSLAPYCQGGQYGSFFDVDYPPLEGEILGINLDPIKDDRTLCSLILILFTNHASSVFQARRSQGRTAQSLLIIDEVHSYLKGGFMADFIRLQMKVLRKFGVSFCVASQSLRDFVATGLEPNPCGEAILESTYYWWLLAQDAFFREFSSDPRRDLARLPKQTLERISTQQTGPGYAPFYLYSKTTPDECGFFRYFASPRELATYSTRPQDHALRIAARHELEGQYSGSELWARAIERVAEQIKQHQTRR